MCTLCIFHPGVFLEPCFDAAISLCLLLPRSDLSSAPISYPSEHTPLLHDGPKHLHPLRRDG